MFRPCCLKNRSNGIMSFIISSAKVGVDLRAGYIINDISLVICLKCRVFVKACIEWAHAIDE